MNEPFSHPLSAEEEKEALKNLSSPEVKSMFIERNLRLTAYAAYKFTGTGIDIEDLISIGTVGLIKAVNSFNTDKNVKFATYASRCINNEILMYLRKNSCNKNVVSIDEIILSDSNGYELLLSDTLGTDPDIVSRNIENEADKALLHTAIQKLSEREQYIIKLRYGIGTDEEKAQKEVAEILGITQPHVSRLERNIIEKLKNILKQSV